MFLCDVEGRIVVALHPLAAALVPLDDVEDVQDAIFVVGRMLDVVPGAALLFQPARVDLHRLTADHEGHLHAGFLVDVLVLEIRALLHLDERAASRVLHDRDAVPLCSVAERRGVDLGDIDDLGADRLEWTGRGVLVIGVASGSSAVGAIAVVGDLLVLHEVDHPDRAIVSWVGGGELVPVFVIDRAVAGHGCSSTKILSVRLPHLAKGSSISATSWSSPVAMR